MQNLSPTPLRTLPRLCELREKLGLVHADIAEQVGICRTHYTRLESGAKTASLDVALRLARVFNVTVDYIFAADAESPDPRPLQAS